MSDAAPLRLCAFALFLSSACAQSPDAELELAADRIETARSAEASVFAADQLTRAEASLATAELMTSEARYLEAVRHAGEAVTHADEAHGVATVEKKIAIRHVDHCLRELEGLMAIARARGATDDTLAPFEERYAGVKIVADHGDLLGALEQGMALKPALLALEQSLR